MSSEKAAAAFHGSACRWGGPQTTACWHVSACGCAVVPQVPPSVSRPRMSLLDRLVLAVMQAPVKIDRKKNR